MTQPRDTNGTGFVFKMPSKALIPLLAVLAGYGPVKDGAALFLPHKEVSDRAMVAQTLSQSNDALLQKLTDMEKNDGEWKGQVSHRLDRIEDRLDLRSDANSQEKQDGGSPRTHR